MDREMPHKVMISYSKADINTALAVCSRLERDKIKCWIAPRNITPGEEWDNEIPKAIDLCTIMVLVLSSSSIESVHVLREVNRAVEMKKRIIPFRIEDVEPAGAMHYYLRVYHWLDAFSSSLDIHLDELALAVRSLLDRSEDKGPHGDAAIRTGGADPHSQHELCDVSASGTISTDSIVAVRSKRKPSAYSSDYGQEASRLSIQSEKTKDLDLRAFASALNRMKGDKDLLALDVGCSSGEVTFTRFSPFSSFRHVVGIDRNETDILKAKKAGYGDKFSFETVDVDERDIESKLRSIVKNNGRDAFDFVFSALTFHHLSRPVELLRVLRRVMKKGGVIVLRGSDDGAKIAFPDDGDLVVKSIALTKTAPGVSDRENGRKLYFHLWKAGFRDIHMLYDVLDTVGLDPNERNALFTSSFSWRRSYFEKALSNSPKDGKLRESYEWMNEALEQLEMEFESEFFYFMLVSIVAIGTKVS